MTFIICVVVGLPLALLIYLAFRLLKRPITAERSVEISAITTTAIQVIPVFVVFVLAFPVMMLVLSLGTLVWIFHPSWFPQFLDSTTTWFGAPVSVWIGGALLTYWAVLSFQYLHGWLRARGLVR